MYDLDRQFINLYRYHELDDNSSDFSSTEVGNENENVQSDIREEIEEHEIVHDCTPETEIVSEANEDHLKYEDTQEETVNIGNLHIIEEENKNVVLEEETKNVVLDEENQIETESCSTSTEIPLSIKDVSYSNQTVAVILCDIVISVKISTRR